MFKILYRYKYKKKWHCKKKTFRSRRKREERNHNFRDTNKHRSGGGKFTDRRTIQGLYIYICIQKNTKA